ncbi:MAG: hypothetical protein WC979_02370 [Candidatus Pacearchaeota archaeon]|jgi:hypothetical protein|nr:hypothetical protein [Clostridia bacterium]
MKEKLKQFAELKKWFSEYFGADIYEGFDDMTEVACWTLDEKTIMWNEDEYSDDPGEYAGDIFGSSIWTKEDYTLVMYDDGCGNCRFAVFNNLTRIKK